MRVSTIHATPHQRKAVYFVGLAYTDNPLRGLTHNFIMIYDLCILIYNYDLVTSYLQKIDHQPWVLGIVFYADLRTNVLGSTTTDETLA